MLEGCIQKDLRSWQFFISHYGAVSRRLVRSHFDQTEGKLDQFLGELLGSIYKENCRFFRESLGSSEREFLLHLQERTLSLLRAHIQTSHNSVLKPEILSQVFTKAPLAYQESTWLALQGYNDEEIGKIMRVPISLARKGRGELIPRLTSYVGETDLSTLGLDQTLLGEIENRKGPNCVAVKAFSKVMDGQMPWREKQVIEQHIAECLYCLDRATSLKETIFHLRNLPPLEEELVKKFMGQIIFAHEAAAAQSSFLTKMFKVFR